ncbi:MAG: hypothetical protein OEN20_08835 [Gammaproteobacteria bacterium]|nr:hypothetical protein [Gammaproteobacteria bacterium]
MPDQPTLSEHQIGRSDRGRGFWHYAWLPLSAALLRVHPLWWPRARQLLLPIGQAELAAVDPALRAE